MWLLAQIYELSIENTFRQLYFKGPSSFGFWSGQEIEDICYSITSTPASFWMLHYTQCVELCEQRFQSFMATVNFVLYFFVVYRVIQGCFFYMFVIRPFSKSFHTTMGHPSCVPKRLPYQGDVKVFQKSYRPHKEPKSSKRSDGLQFVQ